MQKKAEENVFFSHKNLWCCHTPVVNFNAKTIEHRTRTGFLTRDNAEKAYEKASRLFPKELAKLKASSRVHLLSRNTSNTGMKSSTSQ